MIEYYDGMKTKAADEQTSAAEDGKYRALIDQYLGQLDDIHREMKRSKAEIDRLKAASRRRLDATWEILRRVEATL
jgi:hypothetical protein